MVLSRGVLVHTAGPNVALVKSSGRKDVRVVIGGRMFAIPILQRVDSLSLALRTIIVQTTHGLTVNGVSVDVTSACQVKIQGWNTRDDATSNENADHRSESGLHMDYAAVRLAAQHFLGKADQEIDETIEKTIAGHQRAIIGVLTVEELYRDRKEFRRRVLELIASDMRNMGLIVVSYTVAEISDANGYIEALGVTQTEIVKREAAEGLALNQAQARLNVERQKASAHIEVNRQEELKIRSNKELQIAKAKAEEEVQRRMAVQAKAHSISSAEQDAILFVEQQKAKAAETQAELAVLKQQVEKEKLLKQKVINVEADANLYRAKVNADAMREAAKAEADRVRMLGLAEAEAIKSKGSAEVSILRERNQAWQESYVFFTISKFAVMNQFSMRRQISTLTQFVRFRLSQSICPCSQN